MRVIICGAGQVGYSIAAYLAREENDITVIDINQALVAQINEDLDVNGIHGHASNPEVLAQAGADEVDMIIAVTHSDEVNMIACQVAHSLFNVPKKIARIREQSYLDPAWSNLFSRSHLPIDMIISPEIEVARTIVQRLMMPGTTNVIPFVEGRIQLVGLICLDNCPVMNTPMKQFPALFPALNIRIGLILRDGVPLIPGPNDQILVGDEVFFFIDSRFMKRAMAIFGHEENTARHIIITGGGNVGLNVAQMMREDHKDVHLKIIEQNMDRARFLSESLPGTVVLNGDALNPDILQEANIAGTETLIAVTNDDETNILGSLLAKQNGCQRVITLVNSSTYTALLSHLGIDVAISPRSSTVSRIMQTVRRGRIKALHTLRDGCAEVIEAEVSDTISLVNKTIDGLNLPRGVIIGAVVRENEMLELRHDTMIKPGDRVITVALEGQARRVEKMFTVQVDLF